MVKYCIVKGCINSKNNKKLKKELKQQRNSLFTLPNNPDVVRRWSQILGQDVASDAKVNTFICDKHFQEEYILRQDIINIPGQKPFVSERKKITLLPGAIPTLHKNDNQVIPSTNTPTNENESIVDHLCESQLVTNDESVEMNQQVSVSLSRDDCIIQANDIGQAERINSELPELNTDFSIHELLRNLETVKLPKKWSWVDDHLDSPAVVLCYLDYKSFDVKFRVKIDKVLNVVVTNGQFTQSAKNNFIISSMEKFWEFLEILETSQMCSGSGFDSQKSSEACTVFLTPDEQYKKQMGTYRCDACRQLRKKKCNQLYRPTIDINERNKKLKRDLNSAKKKCTRLTNKNVTLKQSIENERQKCANACESIIEQEIFNLPPIQQISVRACFAAAKVKNSKQRRYTIEWGYECLLIRIKSASVYERLRSRQILPLPCKDTLQKYIQKLDSAFGFDGALFETLKLKGSRMEANTKRGTLLLDEVALSEAIKLNQRTMQLDGFVDLGSHTPESELNTRADHALVFMFQPFQGDWVQVIGCFLSRNATVSDILHKLIIESVLLLENAGFKVDAVTCDGAQWNRGAWKLFGIEDYKFSCQHPHDPSRRLWFISDFSHLLKNFRNKIMEMESFWTPDGYVYRKHWEALLTHENRFRANLCVTYKLTPGHIKPEQYQKMNVLLAVELFSKRLRVAMEMFEDQCPELKGCKSTITFMERVDRLITAMTSRTPENALRPDISCEIRKAITDFIQYLREWEAKAIAEKQKYKELRKHLEEDQLPGKFFFAITSSTLTGLKISLGATLELCEFLHMECNYDYLMTIRLTQDALEKFFGIMRSACGCNDHPDVMLFAQVYRLLCSYSLATPPKGSNVTAGELLQSLMQTKDSLALASAPKNEWLKKLDAIVENGIGNITPDEQTNNGISDGSGTFSSWLDNYGIDNDENLSVEVYEDSINNGQTYSPYIPFEDHVDTTDDDDDTVVEVQQAYCRKPFESLLDDSDDNADNDSNTNEDDKENLSEQQNTLTFQDPHLDHDYDIVQSSDEIVAYIAGYMVRKTSRYTKCCTCIDTLQSTDKAVSGRDKFIELMNDGGLIYPSKNLFLLIKSLEEDVLTVVGTKTIKCNTMHQILDKISLRKSLPSVGCHEHTKQITVKIMNYFIVMRGNFLAKLFNKNLSQRKLLTKKHRKSAKLA